MYMFNNAELDSLKSAHDSSIEYLRKHPDLQIVDFLNSAQFDCDELFETCYFGGKQFDCCRYMNQSITSLGKCWEINLTPEMKKQASQTIAAKGGLQIVANARQAEQYTNFHYSSFQENGFRYFIHPPKVSPDLASEGITVSPSRVVNSAIKAILHDLLNRDNWGNCTSDWPENYSSELPYSSSVCQALCVANHFEKLCECIPYSYNINNKPDVCFPYEEVACMKEKMTKTDSNGTVSLDLPFCAECHLACQRSSFNSYTSYGNGFDYSSMIWLKKLTGYTESYIKKNIAIINIHFMELFYTEYSQVKNTSVLNILKEAVQENEEIKSRRSSSANLKSLDDEEQDEDFWYRNPHPYSDSSLDNVIQLAIDFNKSRRESAKSLPDIPEGDEDTVSRKLILRF
uniref:Amiloride-sensitive sodium channel n=1 Tax=Caenorhabditis tropicalis TaxID=1561998 RepID=A0A1I7TQS7_9PELO